jgi:DNA-directed RNA polymerase specialized sigma24 family protein
MTIQLRSVEGLSRQEIANRLGQPTSAVNSRVRGGVTSLRAALRRDVR